MVVLRRYYKLWNTSADVGLFSEAFQNMFFSLQYSSGPIRDTTAGLRFEGTMVSEMYHWCKCSSTRNRAIWKALDPQFAGQLSVSISHTRKHYISTRFEREKFTVVKGVNRRHDGNQLMHGWFFHVVYRCATFLVIDPRRSIPFIE